MNQIEELLAWDSRTVMPTQGIEFRSRLDGIVSSLRQRLFLDTEFQKSFEEAKEEQDLSEIEQGIVRNIERELRIYRLLPPDFVKEFSALTSKAQSVWEKAKENSDFESFAPFLEKIVKMSRQKAEYLGYKEHPYDALLDLYEEGWTVSDYESFFESIKPALKEILEKIQASSLYREEHPLEKERYEQESVKDISLKIIKEMGFSPQVARLDISAHPFTVGINRYDARITTRYKGYDFKDPISSTVHEWGHALYELQIPPQLEGTPLAKGASYSVHESQSRFWEKIILHNPVFLQRWYPYFAEKLEFLHRYDLKDLILYFNLVKPGFIRVEADEITYHSHIILRFELEKALLENTIEVRELPSLWKEKMKEYLGIEPTTDKEGVLQDVHWSAGYFGYFPTYSLGTFISGQIKAKIEEEVGSMDTLLETPEGIEKIRLWLKERVHALGAVFPPKETIERALREEFSPSYHLDYLREKYGSIYS